MIRKNAKVILFFYVIATIILLVNNVNTAMAEKQADIKTIKIDAQTIAIKIQKIQEKIANVKTDLKDADSKAQILELEIKLSKLESRLTKLEYKLTEKIDQISHLTSSSAETPIEGMHVASGSHTSSSGGNSSTCHGLINEDNDCDSDMDVSGNTVSLIQPIDDYTTGPCPNGSSTAICANFVYAAYDIPGWYQKGNDFYFYNSGFTNTCTYSGECSTWGIIARLPSGDSVDINMTDAPTGIPMKTNWFMDYQGLLWGSTQPHTHVQILTDGYDQASQ